MQGLLLFITGLAIGAVAAVYLIAILSANTREEEKLDAYTEGYEKGYDDGYKMRDIQSN